MIDQAHSIPCVITVTVHSHYLPNTSDPQTHCFNFAYDVKLQHVSGAVGARLLHRHWFVMDGHAAVKEVRGIGVVGTQPYLGPGDTFEYTSFVTLNTPIGSMFGTYEMIADDGTPFMVEIKAFQLIKHDAVH